MKKEYVVKSIDAAPDGKPYVLVSLMSAKELMDNSSPVSPFGSKVMGFSNMNDMVKELNKMFTGMGGMPGGVTAIKLDMHEYKEMNLSVGDKVYLEITKAENTGI
ncbi:MAG: hypothetical protein ACT4OW_06455 [Nitrososphaerota archaeon]